MIKSMICLVVCMKLITLVKSYNDVLYQYDTDYDYYPKSYEFGYAVKDDYSGTDYNRREVSDGTKVQGEYRVHLPDGRVQIVSYYADAKTGYHADVRYEPSTVVTTTPAYNYNYDYNDYYRKRKRSLAA